MAGALEGSGRQRGGGANGRGVRARVPSGFCRECESPLRRCREFSIQCRKCGRLRHPRPAALGFLLIDHSIALGSVASRLQEIFIRTMFSAAPDEIDQCLGCGPCWPPLWCRRHVLRADAMLSKAAKRMIPSCEQGAEHGGRLPVAYYDSNKTGAWFHAS